MLDEHAQPVYGPRDDADLAKVAAVGLPFWLAGSYGTPERVSEALAVGAAGVQVGTLFALCAESGLAPALRDDLLKRLADGTLEVRTDALASPTGFPFKVASLPATLSEPAVSAQRPRPCDLGYLRVPFERETGGVGSRTRSTVTTHITVSRLRLTGTRRWVLMLYDHRYTATYLDCVRRYEQRSTPTTQASFTRPRPPTRRPASAAPHPARSRRSATHHPRQPAPP